MRDSEAFITLARRYCVDQYAYWSNKYAKERTGTDVPYTYSDEDYNLFPRYNVLKAIQIGVEYYVGQEFENLDECRKLLKEQGKNSQTVFTENIENEIAQKATQEERNKFIEFINSVEESSLQSVKKLPYRRRLQKEESENLRSLLNTKWEYDNAWYPMFEISSNIKTVFIAKDALSKEDLKDIYNFINQNSESNLFEITEDGLDYEVESTEFDPDCYETTYTNPDTSWIYYGSHESTISVGGAFLVNFIEEKFKDRSDILNQWPKLN